jgi:hypothetical protein
MKSQQRRKWRHGGGVWRWRGVEGGEINLMRRISAGENQLGAASANHGENQTLAWRKAAIAKANNSGGISIERLQRENAWRRGQQTKAPASLQRRYESRIVYLSKKAGVEGNGENHRLRRNENQSSKMASCNESHQYRRK